MTTMRRRMKFLLTLLKSMKYAIFVIFKLNVFLIHQKKLILCIPLHHQYISEKHITPSSARNNYSQMNGVHHKLNGDITHNGPESEVHDRSRARDRGSPAARRKRKC